MQGASRGEIGVRPPELGQLSTPLLSNARWGLSAWNKHGEALLLDAVVGAHDDEWAEWFILRYRNWCVTSMSYLESAGSSRGG